MSLTLRDAVIKMGLFDEIPKPAVEVYTKNRQDWEPKAIVEGCHQVHAGS